MIYVIGSGPAGVSSAIALVRQGLEVTMLDVGLELEPERVAAVDRLSRARPEEWDQEALAMLRGNMKASSAGIPMKLSYGSDFPYREDGTPSNAPLQGVMHSFARGGLSNVWGAAILPYAMNDIADWPIALTDLAKHYEEVLSFMEIASVESDDLRSLFPLYAEVHQPLSPSRQAAAFMEDLTANKGALNAQGLYFGSSRLAVRTLPRNGVSGCVYCGLCMHGCPYRLIYNSSDTLEELRKRPNFRYVPGIRVTKVKETNGAVVIQGQATDSGAAVEFRGSRVYVACGVMSSAALMLESLEAYDHALTMLDSQYFLFPFVRFGSTPGAAEEQLHTLAQIFLEVVDPQISPHTVHLQVYTYNDVYVTAIQGMLGTAYSFFEPIMSGIFGRLCVIQGYLHSHQSGRFLLRLQPGSTGRGGHKLCVAVERNPATEPVVRKVIAKLRRNAKLLKGIPAGFLLKLGSPGRSCFHSGGTFPMREKPTAFQSDILGRPWGFQRVHLVDASVLPSVPATTITFSVMANAHRIASLYHET